MNLDFISEQFDTFATFFGAIEDIFDGIQELFGAEGNTDGGTLNNLSSYFDDAPADGPETGDTDVEAGSSFEGSSNDNADADAEAGSSIDGSSNDEAEDAQ